MTSITNAKLGWNDAGTPVSDQFDDVYFSNVNGLEETRYVFLSQNHLPQRWETFCEQRFVIGETGFGTGLNFLAVWQWFDAFRQAHPDAPLKELHFISFEKYPLSQQDLALAHQSWPELAEYAAKLQPHYPIAVPECHRIVLDEGAVTLDLWFGDIKDCLPKVACGENGVIDAWFLDGFAPSKNPEMWSQTLFDGMAALAKVDCTCATFTAAGFVRRGLIDAGFEMKKVKGFGTKREMIAGTLSSRNNRGNIKAHFARSPASKTDDIAIIGGGVASATLAATLIRRGKRVTLYCQDKQPGERASGNRQGAVYPLLNGGHSGVSRVFAPAFLFARQFVEQAAKRFEFDHDWCGVTQLKWDTKSAEKLDKMLSGDFPSDLIEALDIEQTNQVVGLTVDMPSIRYPLGGWLCPAEFTRGLLNELAKDTRFTARYQHKIQALDYIAEQKKWQLTGEHSVHDHSVVVVANGNEFDTLAPTASLPLGQVKGQVSHIPTTHLLSQLKTVLCYDGYMTPVNTNNQHHCIGASYDRAHLDYEFDPKAQQENQMKLRHCIPEQAWVEEVDTSGNFSRQGIRCVSRDHLPFVGDVSSLDMVTKQYQDLHLLNDERAIVPLDRYPDLYAFLGLGSRGLSSAPLMAELLASQICGDPLPLPVDLLDALHPSRMWVRRLKKGKALTEKHTEK